MTPIQWKESSDDTRPFAPSSAQDLHRASSIQKSDPWFAISIALLGLIVGFWLGKSRTMFRPVARQNPSVQIVAPTSKAAVPSQGRTIKMTAELWKFTPNVVRVKQGEKVTLAITSTSGTHGLSVPGLGINATIIQGNSMNVSIPTGKTGVFDFSCSIQCGSGHSDMKGQIIVEA
ncbi:MAG TPA: cupredoxin domain-containing protein [Candidatus Peribacteraceae bacterium]|nr:cupredoxin domain-containing protein [Candidatus Peribacteraceae bacterium]